MRARDIKTRGGSDKIGREEEEGEGERERMIMTIITTFTTRKT